MIPLPPIEPGEPLRVSATLYKTYLACPQQALGRLHGEYPADSMPSFKGSLAHRLFARHLNQGPIDDVAAACKEEIGAGMNMKLQALGIAKPSALAPVIAEVGDLYARFKRFPTDGFRAAEVAIEAELDQDVTLVPRPGSSKPIRPTWQTSGSRSPFTGPPTGPPLKSGW